MKARLSLYRKAEEELYKLDSRIKARFLDFCHDFRRDPSLPGLDLKPLKGDRRIYRAKVNADFRALLTPTGVAPDGTQSWLLIAIRDRKDVYEQLQVAVNRITGEIEFVDLSIVGDSALRRAGITLTPVNEPDSPANQPAAQATTPHTPAPARDPSPPSPNVTAEPLLAAYNAAQLLDLGVAEPLIQVALAVTTDAELDSLVAGAPLLSKDVLYALAAGMTLDEVRAEITAPVQLDEQPDLDDLVTAAERTKPTAVDDAVQLALDEGDFRAWKVFLHPTQRRIAYANYRGPARVSGGPGTGKTIVALHRVKHLVEQLPPGTDKPILLTTYTTNLATDLRLRLASLLDRPSDVVRVDVTHIDQLAARVLGENTSGQHRKQRTSDQTARTELRQLLAEQGETHWDAQFLFDEWEQVILGQSLTTRAEYFRARRAGRGKALTRADRSRAWKLIEQLTARLDKLGVETWGQAAERAARYETDRARRIANRDTDPGGLDDSSGRHTLTYRYRHVVVDEAQDLRAAHWKMLRAMVDPTAPNDVFIAGDTHQRIYDHQVTLGPLGINIRGRSARLTLSYRTTHQILDWALGIIDTSHTTYDDLDDGADTLSGYRSVLRGRNPDVEGYPTFETELKHLADRLKTWRAAIANPSNGRPSAKVPAPLTSGPTTDAQGTSPGRLAASGDGAPDAGPTTTGGTASEQAARRVTVDPTGRIAVCVADRDLVTRTIDYLTAAGLSCAELTKDGPRGDGEIHVGTMHRFKGLEYQSLAIIAATAGIIPRAAIHHYAAADPDRYIQELRRSRSLLFVAATRARDTLAVTWHGPRSPLLPSEYGDAA
ncbi:UvrD-helicase domain-containing protein [Pseudofrankia sp. BMG5.37]|uniref:UvrD-helicase domain-containing protein n=1 Tax=Pseudofrankia sp. BMG5.37 TaxID=3050035 RepID=UPI00289424B7|nr:UvrD-helicase domain-containing protein [Pseudofrankia sp. BMG5.37]MDT3444485.1 UvrD-helicase domain-containing protein [Pseudofrankia sp. BMG5.37]